MDTSSLQVDLSIIIVNYNVKEYIINCIHSIHEKIDANKCPYEVIVSDNGSLDGSVQAIKEQFPWVKIIENNANLGFGKANNRGAAQAQGDVLLFLNPDTLIEYGVDQMRDYLLSHKGIGALCPIVLDQNRTISLPFPPVYASLSMQVFDLFLTPLARLVTTFKKRSYDRQIKRKKIFEVDIVHGCAIMIRKDVFTEIGMFDEHIFMYGEEFDISTRLREEDYKIEIFFDACIIHYGKHSSKQIPSSAIMKIGAQSLKVVLQKHFPNSWRLRYSIEALTHIRQILSTSSKVIGNFFLRKKNDENLSYIRSHITSFKVMLNVLKEK